LYRQGSGGRIKKIWELNHTTGEILPMTDITDKYVRDASIKLFVDASVNPQSNIGYGAYLSIPPEPLSFESLKMRVKVKRFDKTSSTKLELQTLLWALISIQSFGKKIVVYTDSQNIIGLPGRRTRFEKNKRIKNYKLYQEFFKLTDQLNCEFIKIRGHKISHQKNELDKFFTLVDRASRKTLRHQEDLLKNT
jgi:ribonuclease HI